MSLTPPDCVNSFLHQANRLGIEVRWTRDGINNLDAAYHAKPGAPGLIFLRERQHPPTTSTLCTLLTHEMVHVLQHWKGGLLATPPLGWSVTNAPNDRQLSPQEQEAYAAQNQPLRVLSAVRLLQPVSPHSSP